MSSVKVLPRMDRLKTNGEAPLYLRVIKHRKPRYISLKISVLPKHWDDKTNLVKRSHPNSARLNSFICHKLTEARDILIESETKAKYLSATRLKDKIMGSNVADFIDYFKKHLVTLEKEGKIATFKKGKAILSKIIKYNRSSSTLGFEEIDVSWLKGYSSHLKTEYGNAINTVHSNLKVIRKLFNDAIREELIPDDIYPFGKFTLKWEKTEKKDYLTEEEINAICAIELERHSTLDDARNMFVFCCYAGGIRISDLLQLKWENYDGSHINFTQVKTKQNLSIKLPTVAKDVLAKYHNGDYKSKKKEYIFPIMQKYTVKTIRDRHNAMSSATTLINKNLKKVGKLAKLDNPAISNHWARRSFTNLALSKGMNLDLVSKILGHSGETVTVESYTRYSQKRLHDAMDVMG